MKLRLRLIVTALLAVIPVAIVLFMTNEWMRVRDMRLTLDRFITSQLTDDTRERCESNPNWFLAGPRPDRPSPQQLAGPDADVLAPRPQTQDLPFDFFAYDAGFLPLSSAGPRFPSDFRIALKSGSKIVHGDFATLAGTGQQVGLLTGWTNSPCVALLFRIRPVPHQGLEHAAILVSLGILLFGVALAAGAPLVARIRRFGLEARQSATDEYKSPVTVGGHDELSAVAFAFNEAGADIRRRATDVKDREDSLRRYIASTGDNVTAPLGVLEQRLANLVRLQPPPEVRTEINAAVIEAHDLSMRMHNLSVAATLRMSMESRVSAGVDVGALVQRAIARQQGFAAAAGVTIGFTPETPIAIAADADLLEQAACNLIDNAIRYNRPGGHVVVSLDRTRDGRFSLRVADDGPGAPEDVLAKLNANRRFRGDEGRTQRAGDLGLGLAIVREVADRFKIQWAFRKNARGWFEAELTGN